jgi:hypothetical protein
MPELSAFPLKATPWGHGRVDPASGLYCTCKKTPGGGDSSPGREPREPMSHPSPSPGRGDSGQRLFKVFAPPEGSAAAPTGLEAGIAGDPGLTPRATRFRPLRGLRSGRFDGSALTGNTEKADRFGSAPPASCGPVFTTACETLYQEVWIQASARATGESPSVAIRGKIRSQSGTPCRLLPPEAASNTLSMINDLRPRARGRRGARRENPDSRPRRPGS